MSLTHACIYTVHCRKTTSQALKEAEEHGNAISHANSALRDASATSTARMQTISEALRIAGEKAANARADADAAEARASSLATQLKSFKAALDETKRTCESIRTEHDDISSAARDLEGRLLQTESELNRIQKQKAKGDDDRDTMCEELQDLKQTEKMLKDYLDKRDDELLKLKKTLVEREGIEQARQERTERLDNELRNSRSMLVEMTSAAAEAESTTVELQDTISALQRENESLHKRIDETIDAAAKERTKLHEALAEAENEAQKLRLKTAADDEELQKVTLDKISSEKEVLQLKNRLNNVERRLAEVSAVGVLSPSDAISDVSSIQTDFTSSTMSSSYEYKTPAGKKSSGVSSQSSSQDGFSIPKLKSVTPKVASSSLLMMVSKETDDRSMTIAITASASQHTNNRSITAATSTSQHTNSSSRRSNTGTRPATAKCSICFKAPYGIMKSCQCGKPGCDMRAHATCIAGKKPLPSLSHPGTPAPSLPAILCKKR